MFVSMLDAAKALLSYAGILPLGTSEKPP